jgi:DNA topoisomerase-3
MISYGPCQTPALSFCVDRLREIETFEGNTYWSVGIEVQVTSGETVPLTWKVSPAYAVEDTRNKMNRKESSATFDQSSANRVVKAANGSQMAVVKSVTQTSEALTPPVALNTVALLEMGSKALGMSPKNVMNVAEKLYGAGLISYPRTGKCCVTFNFIEIVVT